MSPTSRVTAIAAFAALLVASPAAAACRDAHLEAAPETVDRVRVAIVCVINEHRADAGLGELRASKSLDESAGWHSADMVAHAFLAHEGPGRPTLFRRVAGSGYFAGAGNGLYSENIGVAPLGGASAERVVDAWLASSDHRANVLYPTFKDLGVGAAFSEADPVFYPGYASIVLTTDFGRRDAVASKPRAKPSKRCRASRQRAAPGGSATKPRRWCRRR